MSLVSRAKEDIQKITSNLNEWGVDLVLLPIGSNTQYPAKGVHTKHHLGLTSEGIPANVKTASVAISEANFPVDYPIRDANGEVKLKGHRCYVNDSTGIQKKYIIREWFPDEMIGLIVLILGDFE